MTDTLCMELFKQIVQLRDSFGHLPKQGTPQWLELRKYSIGGSEMSTLFGINPYNKLQTLVAEKAGVQANPFRGSTPTRWGKLFESVTATCIKDALDIKFDIIEFSSIPSSELPGQAYSPDGLSVVRLLCKRNGGTPVYKMYAILFEFKAPFSTMPGGFVPHHYMPQVQAGLLAFPICRACIFVNNVYRKCSMDDLRFNNRVDTEFHKKPVKDLSPLAIGFIGFYSPKPKVLSESERAYASAHSHLQNEDIFDLLSPRGAIRNHSALTERKTAVDFGSIDISAMLSAYEDGAICAKYYPLSYNFAALEARSTFVGIQNITRPPFDAAVEEEKQRRARVEFTEWCATNNMNEIGVLPYKLFVMDVILVHRDPAFKDKAREAIDKTMQMIRHISLCSTTEEKIKRYQEYFPIEFTARSTFAVNDLLDEDDVVATAAAVAVPVATASVPIATTSVETPIATTTPVEVPVETLVTQATEQTPVVSTGEKI